MQEDYFPPSDVYSREGFAEFGNIRTVSANEAASENCFLALLLTVAVARAQDAATMAAQQAALQAAQQTQQDLMATGQATLLGLQQIQFDQLVMQQMQVAGGRHEQVPRQYSSVE
jgi:hypothetical protein